MADFNLRTESAQVDFLLDLGKRLDNWVWPGSPDDVWLEGTPLITPEKPTYLTECRGLNRLFLDGRPRKVRDVVMTRLFRIAHAETRQECLFNQTSAQRHYSENAGKKSIVLKSGKIGFSTLIALRGLLKIITNAGNNAFVLSYDDDSVKKVLFPLVHFAIDRMPDPFGSAFRKGALRAEFSSVNEIFFPVLNSRFRVASAGNKNAAVSSSIQFLHGSEVSRWDKHDPQQLLSNLLSHMVGDHREVHLESRPNGDVGIFPETYWEAVRGQNDFTPFFYEWFWDYMHQAKDLPEGFVLTPEEVQRATRYVARYGNTKKSTGLPALLGPKYFAWYREKEKDLKDKVGQEYAENEIECFKGSGNNPFSANAIADIANRDDQPVDSETADGRPKERNGLWYWKKPEDGKKYIIFCDTAGGEAGSRTAIQVLEWETLEQCAEYAGRISYESQPGLLRTLALLYNRALIAVENNHGNATGTIAYGLHDYDNCYWHMVGESKVFGWPTNKNRDEMLDYTVSFVKEFFPRLHSTRLAAELKSAERRDDKIVAKKGYTFDVVMALAGALSVRRTYGRTIAPWAETINVGGGGQTNKKVEGEGVDTGWNRLGGGIAGGDGFGASDAGSFGKF